MADKRKQNNPPEAFRSFGNEPDTSKRPKQQDQYCWLCHRNETNVDCSTCIRSYHQECIGKQPKSMQHQCETCKRLSTASACTAGKFTSVEHLNRLLDLTTKRLIDDQEFNVFDQSYYDNHEKTIEDCGIVNPIHLGSITDKAQNSEYESTVDFINDIKWICHNVYIMDGRDNKTYVRIAKRLEKFCMKEIYDIEMCYQCYLRSNTQTNWFTAVCNPPHLLVWARVNNQSGYAPAKILGLNGNAAARKVDVRFFADHEMALVSSSNCYVFSKQVPSGNFHEQTKFKRVTALQEVGMYVSNIRQIYPDFTNAEHRTPFEERKIVKHLTDMYPGVRIPRDYQLITKPKYLNRLIRRHAPVPLQLNDDDEDKTTTSPQETPVLIRLPLLLSPTIILEKCDPLVALQQRNANFQYPIIDKVPAEAKNSGSQESNVDEGSEGEADMDLDEDIDQSSSDCPQLIESEPSNGECSTRLFNVPVSPMHISTYEMMQNIRADVHFQDIVAAQNKTTLLNSIGLTSVGAKTNTRNSNPIQIQSYHFQRNETQEVASFGCTANQLSQITNSTEPHEEAEACVSLPLSTVSEPPENATMNRDWEEVLDKYEMKVRDRQRINRKIILNREKAHQLKLNQLKSTVIALKRQNNKLRTTAQAMDGWHNERLKSMVQSAIEETKRKKWCWNCQTELKHVAFNIPMCKDCVHRNWFGNDDNLAEPEEVDAEQNESTSGFQNIVFLEQPIVNEHLPQQSNNVDQLLADFSVVDPLSVELELGGF